MALPEFSMRQLLEAGVHFGHQAHRWNPKMKKYIYGIRGGIHIIDLSKTVPLLHQALLEIRDIVAKGGRVLFVGTKRQASEIVAESAKRCAQYYVNHRWLGGTLTNWGTVSKSIKRYKELNALFDKPDELGLTKKELLNLQRERNKLDKALGGIADMGGLPSAIFVVDTNKEAIAVKEARKLDIPVIAVVDTNCDPDQISNHFPGNDDASRAVSLYCNLIADAIIDGLTESTAELGVDIGELEDVADFVKPDLAAADAINEETSGEDTGEEAPATSSTEDDVSLDGEVTEEMLEVLRDTKSSSQSARSTE